MNIVCVKRCRCHNVDYIPGNFYSYDEYDCIDGLDIKYYAIYNVGKKCMGYANKGFIDENFASVFEYNQELGYITSVFNFFMDFKFEMHDPRKEK